MLDEKSEAFVRRHARRNFWLNVADGGIFTLGLSMVSRYTVLPLLVERLSGERWMQGLIPAIWYAGWLLPGLFMAPLVAGLRQRKPLIMTATLGERAPFFLLGLVILTWPQLSPWLLLAIFFALYAVHATSAGLTSTAWQDFISRVTPQARWGTFFGFQSAAGGILGLVGAGLAAYILATEPFPISVGILALGCFVAMMLSYITLGLTVEPPSNAPPRQSMLAFLSGIGPLLRRDQAFRRYLFCRGAIAMGLTGHSFLTAAALERFGIVDSDVAVLTGLMLAAQAAAAIGLGVLADRWGHKQVLEISTGLGLLALLTAIAAPSAAWYWPIFVLVGASQAGYLLAGFTLVFSFSTPAERPTYIGVSNTALAPVAALGPLLAGWLAEAAGYNTLFLTLLAIGIAGLATLHWGVLVASSGAQRA